MFLLLSAHLQPTTLMRAVRGLEFATSGHMTRLSELLKPAFGHFQLSIYSMDLGTCQ